MEVLHEAWPVLAGMFLPPLVALATRSRPRWFSYVLPALALGICASLLAGEVSISIGSAALHVAFDSFLALTGSYLSYRLFWRQILKTRLRTERDESSTRPRR
ncbi:MAG TPA: hypothetical protein VJN88_15140 [Ktedonobacterales bacterium]|nr:hypothetical protein [Ktedonobacterales bacterium]